MAWPAAFHLRSLSARLGEAFERAVRRFPLVVLAASAMTAAWCGLVLAEFETPGIGLVRALLTASLGLPWLIAAALCRERMRHARLRFLPETLVIAGLAIFAATLPPELADAPAAVRYLWLALVAAGHLTIPVAPFATDRRGTLFWRFAIAAFLRAILAALFTTVLFAGLALALFSFSRLFGVALDHAKVYGVLFGLSYGVFQTLYVLGGIPRLDSADEIRWLERYPAVLRFPCQFVLAPLAAIFLALLYAYALKILLRFEWPEGFVALPVLLLGAGGMLLALLVHPLRRPASEGGEFWARAIWRILFPALGPLAVLLFLAVQIRVAAYGVTEPRWLGLALACWLFAVAVAYALRPWGGIRWLPASLAIIAAASVLGPWSALQTSFHSQRARLVDAAQRHGMLDADGALQPRDANRALESDARRNIASILRYLLRTHGADRLKPELANYFARESADPDPNARDLLQWLKAVPQGDPDSWRASAHVDRLDTEGFSTAYAVDLSRDTQIELESGSNGTPPAGQLTLRIDGADLHVTRESGNGAPAEARFDLGELAEAASDGASRSRLDDDTGAFETSAGNLRFRLRLKSARLRRDRDASSAESWRIADLDGWLLVGDTPNKPNNR